ncbi:MAG: MFS transporter, partial [Candidatus Dormibacteraceae bacterium]
TWLEVAVIVGLVAGSVLLSRGESRRPALAMAGGVALFGLGALGIALGPWLVVALIGFLVTGVANAIYSVRNRTVLMQAAGEDEQGSVMSTRYSIAQASQIVGLGLGALVAAVATPRGAFLVVGAGLLLVAGAFMLHFRRRRRVVDAAFREP